MSEPLDDPSVRLGLAGLATFLAVGVGIGVAGYFSLDAFGSGDGFGAQLARSVFGVVSVVFVSLVGAPVAATVGARSGASPAGDLRAYLAVAASSLVGHIAMFVVAITIISSKLGSGSDGSGINLGEFLGPMALAAVGVALTGVAVAAAVRYLDP